MAHEVWWAAVHRVTKNQTRLKRQSMHAHIQTKIKCDRLGLSFSFLLKECSQLAYIPPRERWEESLIWRLVV